MEEVFEIEGISCQGLVAATPKATLVMVRGPKSLVGCGYFDLAAADAFAEPVAIVKGVRTIEEILAKRVVAASKAAQSAGVTPGMSGREALVIMENALHH